MILSGQYFAPGSWLVRYSAAMTALAILSFGVAPAQEGAEDAKQVVKKRDDDSPKFDVMIRRPDAKEKSERAKPTSILITFADGSTQKVDISKYGFVTIDVGGQRVLMHPAGEPPKFNAGPMSPLRPRASVPGDFVYPRPPALPTGPDPVRVPLDSSNAEIAPVVVPRPKGFEPGKGPVKDKLESREKGAKKHAAHGGKTKKRKVDDDRLDRLEAMLRDLQKEMKSLHAEIKRHE